MFKGIIQLLNALAVYLSAEKDANSESRQFPKNRISA